LANQRHPGNRHHASGQHQSRGGTGGQADGFRQDQRRHAVELYTLKNDKGMTAKIMTYGATLVELHVPDKDGKPANVVLGFDDLAGYESDANQYFGCTVGRVCNRIARASSRWAARTTSSPSTTSPTTCTAASSASFDKVVWKAKDVSDRAANRFS